jgi:hypothetical protein
MRRALRGNGQGADPHTAAIEEDAAERPAASWPAAKPILMRRKEPNHA